MSECQYYAFQAVDRPLTDEEQETLRRYSRRQEEDWLRVESLIAIKLPKNYDEAVALLAHLRELCAREGREAEAAARIARLRQEHAGKPSLMKRLRQAGLHK